MKFHLLNSFIIFGLVFVLSNTGANRSADASQVEIFKRAIDGPIVVRVPQDENQEEKADEKTEEDDEPVTDTKSLIGEEPELAKNFVRFHMWDGSIVAGEVEFDNISVQTEFGVLTVPIEKIRKLYPGLNSFPELRAKIETLVEALGDKDFDVREKSQRELASMGNQIRNELDNFKDGGNAERKKRLETIRKQLNEAEDEFEDDESSGERSLIRGDSVVTPEFSIVGKIVEETFTLNSKFGKLTVQLGDIKMAERTIKERRGSIKKTVTVGAEKFFQRQAVSTRIRVNKGDKISIKADGVVQWTNWSTTSSPEGQANQGVYEGIQSGALCARIGSNGKIVKIGSKHEWTASKSGVLTLAIAMQDNYLNNNGYKWTGEYKAKVTVEPGDTK